MNLFLEATCILAFGAACWAGGDLLLKLFFNEPLPVVARHTLAFTVGNVAFSYFLTALGFAGLYIPWVLKAVFFAGIGLAFWKVIIEERSLHSRLAKRLLQHGRGSQVSIDIQEIGKDPERRIFFSCENEVPRNKKDGSIALFFLGAVVMLFLIPAILQAAAPPYVRDALVYHLLCPKEYLKAGRLVHIQGNLFSAFPKGHEVLMTLLLSNAGDRAAQGFSVLQQVAAIGDLYSLTYSDGWTLAGRTVRGWIRYSSPCHVLHRVWLCRASASHDPWRLPFGFSSFHSIWKRGEQGREHGIRTNFIDWVPGGLDGLRSNIVD